MLTRKSFITTLLIAGGLTAPALAQRSVPTEFASMDRDGDGVITRSEWRGSIESFRDRDWNADGVLSGNEVRSDTRRPVSATRGSDPYDNWTAAGFTGADRNRDNRVTRDEWSFDRATFDRADYNRDSVLTRNEFQRMGRGVGTSGTAAYTDWTAAGFTSVDRNRDNRIARGEWTFDRNSFDRADTNRDGFLTRREFLSADTAAGTAAYTDWTVAGFNSVDRNRDNRVTRSEWTFERDSFDRADSNRDGLLTRSEFLNAATETGAYEPRQGTTYQLGYDRGMAEGRTAGLEDRQRNQGWDLDGQRELEAANSGYEPRFGSLGEYQNGYRAGFRLGYPEGWNSGR